ncbi:hypothetical protein HFD88_006367 [Aspergillus terreus]|nr:hypothetical protein HFD88_006367 [Aspergillus terreus]
MSLPKSTPEQVQPDWTTQISVLFVLGGLGSGKGTQCKSLQKHGFAHLSVGDVLRDEINRPDSKYGPIIRSNMEEGPVGAMEITIELLKQAFEAAFRERWYTIFLLDGFPRKMDQALFFETEICSPRHILYLQCPENVMVERLQLRSETSGRFDDKLDTMRKRLDTFNEVSLPVIRHYMAKGKVSEVDATKNKEEVYRDLEVILERVGLAKKDVLDDEPW